MSRYFARDGTPLTDVMDVARRYENLRYSTVRKTQVGTVDVSTVWLGINHNFGGGLPLIFETMVFGGSLDQEQDRYATEEEAIAGHDAMVRRVVETDGGAPLDTTEDFIQSGGKK